MKNGINHAFGNLFSITGHVSGIVLIGAMILILIEVVTRYLLPYPFMISEEYSGYALVAITFLGLPYTLNRGGHLRITFVVQLLPARVSNWLRVITLTLFLFWSALATVVSVQYVQDSFNRGIRSITPQMTLLAWPRLVIPVGYFLLFVSLGYQIHQTVKQIKAGISVEKKLPQRGAKGETL